MEGSALLQSSLVVQLNATLTLSQTNNRVISDESSSQWDANLPTRLFATNRYPKGRLNVYSKRDTLSFICNVFNGTEEFDHIL